MFASRIPSRLRAFAVSALILMMTVPSVVLAQAPSPAPTKYAMLTYPVPGNLDWDEGTVEMWVRFDFDTTIPKQPHSATLFDVMAPEGEQWHYILGYIGWGQSLAQIGYTKPQHSYVWSGKVEFKPTEWHYIVWTWSGRSRSVFIDGKHRESGRFDPPLQGEGRGNSTKDVVVEGWMYGTQTGAELNIGRAHSVFTVDEIRVSSIARTPVEIAQIFEASKAPARDEFTLLLDHCDGGPAEVVSGLSGETSATITAGHKVIENARFGKAIQLWTE